MSTFHQSDRDFDLGGQRSLAEKMFDRNYVLPTLQAIASPAVRHRTMTKPTAINSCHYKTILLLQNLDAAKFQLVVSNSFQGEAR